MQIILESMYKKRPTALHDMDKVGLSLFNYLYNKDIITHEDFERAIGNSLKNVKFFTEMNVKIKLASIRALHTFLAEKKDIRFLEQLRQDDPQLYAQAAPYIKEFYRALIAQQLKQLHDKKMHFSQHDTNARIRFSEFGSNFSLHALELKKHLQHIIDHPADPQYNAFILSGDGFGGTLILEKLSRTLAQKYPQHKMLHFRGHAIHDVIQSNSLWGLGSCFLLFPDLRFVMLSDLDLSYWARADQEKLALFLQALIDHGVQVLISTSDTADYNGMQKETRLCEEIRCFFASARNYTLPYRHVRYEKELTCSLTLEQDRSRYESLARLKESTSFGRLYPGILSQEKPRIFNENMPVELNLLWLGSFEPPAYLFPRAFCPNCGKWEMIPYSCMASVLSGEHVIKFHCLNCNERLANNDVPDYYHMLRAYGAHPCYRHRNGAFYTLK